MNLKIINYFQYFFRKKKKLLLKLDEYSTFLENGDYTIQPSYAYLKDYKIFFPNELINIFLKIIYIKRVNIYSREKNFRGKVIFLNAKGSIKIFNNEAIVTFFKKNELQTLLMTYRDIDIYFNYPKIFEIKKNYYIEEFIIDSKNKSLVELYEIYSLLLNFYNNQEIEFKYCDDLDIEWEKLTLKNQIFVKSLNFKYNKYPYIVSHNDIHFGNILKNNKLYLIDWEYYGKNLFFYDFINILFIEALHGDTRFLDNFFNGKLDKYFEKLFNIFQLPYNKDYKMKYLDTYILQKILLRDMQESESHLNRVLNNYKKVRDLYC